MLKLVGRKMSQVICVAATDRVVGAYPLPQGGVLSQIDLGMKLVGPVGEALAITKAVMYGVDIYIVPVIDPDATLTYELAWDRFVPKDEVAGTNIDIDTTAADVSPVFEQGGIDINAVFNMTGLAPRRIFRRRKLVGFGDGVPTVGAAAADTWNPSDVFQTVIKQRVRVNQPSYVLIGLSSPALTVTSTSIWVPPTGEQEWAMLQYMQTFLERAFIGSLGFVETGAETPYVETELYIERMLEDVIFEETADAFHPINWVAHTQSTFQISVPGELQQRGVLTSDNG